MRLGLIYHQCRHKDIALTRLVRWYDEVDKSGFLVFGRVARAIQTYYIEIINILSDVLRTQLLGSLMLK